MKRDNHPDDQIDYYQEQKHGIVDIFVNVKIPIRHYETAYGFSRIANYISFDEYVSHCIVRDVEQLLGGEIADDLIHEKLTGKNSPWMQNQKEHWSGVNKRLKKLQKAESGR